MASIFIKIAMANITNSLKRAPKYLLLVPLIYFLLTSQKKQGPTYVFQISSPV